VKTKAASGATAAVAVVVASIVVGSQMLASAGPTTLRPQQRGPVAASSQTAEVHESEDVCADDECGNAHSQAIRAWVKCKAEKGKDACTKPVPPGQARGHMKLEGKAPGPADTQGQGHGWGRAHAPGQLKNKDKAKSDTDDEDSSGSGG
jgi:hypothetical protein